MRLKAEVAQVAGHCHTSTHSAAQHGIHHHTQEDADRRWARGEENMEVLMAGTPK